MRVRLSILLLCGCAEPTPPALSGSEAPAAPDVAHLPAVTGSMPAPPASVPGLDAAALRRLLERARASHSEALAIRHGGRLVLFESFGQPPSLQPCMSITKSVVSLAIGLLLDAKRLASVDTPVAHFYPEWALGPKSAITIRHLLTHTSGLATTEDTGGIYASGDFVAHALEAPVVAPPGSTFAYDNRAVNLLGGLVARAAGQPLDAFVAERLFTPLGIDRFHWRKDRAGHAEAMAGLALQASDLAKIGQLMLDGGRYGGRQVVSEAWVTACTRPSQELERRCGLLWWLIPDTEALEIDDGVLDAWRSAGIEPPQWEKLTPLRGRALPTTEFRAAVEAALGGPDPARRWRDALRRANLPEGRAVLGTQVGFAARGFLGQQLIVLPHRQLVAVRMIGASHEGPGDDFEDFLACVRAL